MRMSVDPDDPGYANYIANRPARVFLDGIERDMVFTADEERRFIIMAVRDERGNLKIKGDMVVREKWTGNVHIEVEPYATGGEVKAQPVANSPTITLHVNTGAKGSASTGQVIAQSFQRALRRNS